MHTSGKIPCVPMRVAGKRVDDDRDDDDDDDDNKDTLLLLVFLFTSLRLN